VTDGGAALAGVLGAGTGLGLVLIFCGLRGTTITAAADPRWRAIVAHTRHQATVPRVAVTLLSAAAVGAVTRWPVGTVLAGLAAWFLPPVLGPDCEHARVLERIEAVA
jgi:hypothetical protein